MSFSMFSHGQGFSYDQGKTRKLRNPPSSFRGLVYEGGLQDGKPHGKGRVERGPGESYEGHFKEGAMHGWGRMTFGNGDEYEGEFRNGRMESGVYKRRVIGRSASQRCYISAFLKNPRTEVEEWVEPWSTASLPAVSWANWPFFEDPCSPAGSDTGNGSVEFFRFADAGFSFGTAPAVPAALESTVGQLVLPALNNESEPASQPSRVAEAAKPTAAKQTYEMSDSDSESDSDEEENQRPRKTIPEWSQKANLHDALERQFAAGPNRLDPDKIFGEVLTCDLEEIFGKKTSKYRKRTSSGNWSKDGVLPAEKVIYKRHMAAAHAMPLLSEEDAESL